MRASILRNSLIALYKDSDEILEALNLIDFTALNNKFYREVFERITEDHFWEVDEFLNSDKVMQYQDAINQAAVACTTDIAKLIELAMVEKGVKH